MFAVVGRSVIFVDGWGPSFLGSTPTTFLSPISVHDFHSIDAMIPELSQLGSLDSRRVSVICGFGVDFSSSPFVSVVQVPASSTVTCL
jgi:hypothetical protein